MNFRWNRDLRYVEAPWLGEREVVVDPPPRAVHDAFWYRLTHHLHHKRVGEYSAIGVGQVPVRTDHVCRISGDSRHHRVGFLRELVVESFLAFERPAEFFD